MSIRGLSRDENSLELKYKSLSMFLFRFIEKEINSLHRRTGLEMLGSGHKSARPAAKAREP